MRPINPTWRRHDAHRFIRHDAHRFLTPAGNEEEKRAAAGGESRAAQAGRGCGRSRMRSSGGLERCAANSPKLKLEFALRRIEHKYRPDQPRDERGRWVDDPDKGRRRGRRQGGSGQAA